MTLDEMFHKRAIKTIGVVGMGYVGIPSALLFADAPCYTLVYGFQRDSKSSGYKIDMLNRGESPLKGEEPGLEPLLKKVIAEKKFTCTSDFSKISECDAVTVTIQTPFLKKDGLTPDFSALDEGLKQIGKYMVPGMLVVLESTVTPGTTKHRALSILEEASGLVAGVEFGLAHAPERVMIGRLLENIRCHDRIIGGIDDTSTKRAVNLYLPVLTKGDPIAMSATAAEITKTAENAFRDLQIATVNELALYCEAMKINVYDVRRGIDSLQGRGISREILYPGAGVGGHCLTKDTYHLECGVRVLGRNTVDFPMGQRSLFISARKINDFMPDHMYNLTMSALNRVKRVKKKVKITILGWAYMADTEDTRNTPSEQYYKKMKRSGAEVIVHDPYAHDESINITDKLLDAIQGSDAVAIFTAHSQYKLHLLNPAMVRKCMGSASPIIIDGRNVIDADAYIKEGFVYKGIGRGDKNDHKIMVIEGD